VRKIVNSLGIELVVINLAEEFLEIVKNPMYGYGSNINPCIDCKILMLKKAKELMQKIDAEFLITGEVAGQRPMSQKTHTLNLIERKAGVEGILVRPLSAKVLQPTEPEKSGWINRDKLLGISGRGRKAQFALAKELNISDYSNPSGGCLLTYEGYAKKVEDLIKYKELTLDNVPLLKIGRHFRLSPGYKLMVGKDEKENSKLLSMVKPGDFIYEPNEEVKGPIALGRGEPQDVQFEQSCKIVARYCDDNENNLEINIKRMGSDFEKKFSCRAFSEKEIAALRL
jgi:hypothetical protein